MTDQRNGIFIDVRGDAQVRALFKDIGRSVDKSLVEAINRTARDLRVRMVRKTTDVYNISPRELSPYVTVSRASAGQILAKVSLKIRAIPIEAFKPRVRLQNFTYQVRGRTVTRKLPAIYLKRYRNGTEHYVAPAFPLSQRSGGVLKRGEQVRRRIGRDRDRLTRLRYYTFPRKFVDDVLLPDALQFIPEHVLGEIRRQTRRFNSKLGRTVLAK